MATITFDTLKFVRKLREAGFEGKQAEAVAEAFKDASSEADIATKRDIEGLRQEFREHDLRVENRFESIKDDLTLLKWMLGLVVAAEVLPWLAKLFA